MYQNTIVIFTIDRAILTHGDAFAINSKLDEIQRNFFVKGVVLDIDSPGGTSEAIEEIYYRIVSLRESKAVVASINSIGASGAYYIASPSDYIFSKPLAYAGKNAKSNLGFQELVALAANEYRKGKVIAICDGDLWANELIEKFDNKNLLINIVNWIVAKED